MFLPQYLNRCQLMNSEPLSESTPFGFEGQGADYVFKRGADSGLCFAEYGAAFDEVFRLTRQRCAGQCQLDPRVDYEAMLVPYQRAMPPRRPKP